MKSIYDVLQYLKRYGTFIYTTDRQADLLLMEDEIRELYNSHMMEIQDFQMAILLIRQERSRLIDKNIK
ncbi:YqgQ family protein [Paenisporosarcina quisquiliarum]|uniref:YqgQ family protein n=1 Tax=Paenisporosarcina quisquiliarum TaxID=365346 RepID=A0A9X3RD56_9BACL|nr:YqgQ family protein [Paenisporosarcina quisquiliarum]MCZ8536027.1 YqgQ family protein [Paenisporosarcina quisquiliarum]